MIHDLGDPSLSGNQIEWEEADAPALGDASLASSGLVELEDVAFDTVKLLVQDGPVLYQAIIGGGADPAGSAAEVVEFMMNGKPGQVDVAEDIDFDPRGNSTGGYFDVMPGSNDVAALAGLEPHQDDVFIP